jgi:hypothetical protein
MNGDDMYAFFRTFAAVKGAYDAEKMAQLVENRARLELELDTMERNVFSEISLALAPKLVEKAKCAVIIQKTTLDFIVCDRTNANEEIQRRFEITDDDILTCRRQKRGALFPLCAYVFFMTASTELPIQVKTHKSEIQAMDQVKRSLAELVRAISFEHSKRATYDIIDSFTTLGLIVRSVGGDGLKSPEDIVNHEFRDAVSSVSLPFSASYIREGLQLVTFEREWGVIYDARKLDITNAFAENAGTRDSYDATGIVRKSMTYCDATKKLLFNKQTDYANSAGATRAKHGVRLDDNTLEGIAFKESKAFKRKHFNELLVKPKAGFSNRDAIIGVLVADRDAREPPTHLIEVAKPCLPVFYYDRETFSLTHAAI